MCSYGRHAMRAVFVVVIVIVVVVGVSVALPFPISNISKPTRAIKAKLHVKQPEGGGDRSFYITSPSNMTKIAAQSINSKTL